MKRQLTRISCACLSVVTSVALVAKAGQSPTDRLAAIQKAGPAASITVFPTLLGDKPVPQVGDVIGIMLEKAGMNGIESSHVAATVTPGSDATSAARQFGEFVRTQQIKTDYALFAEFIGTHGAGFTEVRTVIVDKTGSEIWTDRQTKSDAEFNRIAPREPMQCCVLVSQRIKTALKLPDPPAGQATPGKVEKRFSEEAGMPSDREQSDMAPRLAALKKLGAGAEIEVYPVQINGMADADAARHLVKLLGDAKICKAHLGSTSPVFTIKASMNEQTRLWDLARASRTELKRHSGDAPYALFAEYMLNPRDKTVGAVHFVVCDHAGEWVIVDFQNNHHADFNSVSPHSADDCGKLVQRRLTGHLK